MKNLRLKPSITILITIVLTILIFELDKILPDTNIKITIKLILLLLGGVISLAALIKSINDSRKIDSIPKGVIRILISIIVISVILGIVLFIIISRNI